MYIDEKRFALVAPELGGQGERKSKLQNFGYQD